MMPDASALRPTWLREMNQAALRAYAELSGDRNPIHLDRERAIQAGHPDVICHGMLAMTDIAGWLTRAMAGWRLVDISCRFVAPMAVGTRLQVSGACIERLQDDEAPRASVIFTAENGGGDVKVKGQAVFEKSSAGPVTRPDIPLPT